VYAEALAVAVTVTADFMFNRWDLEILPYYRIRHILVPWCVRYHERSLRLEAFEYFYVGRGCSSPELYSVGPDWFQYSFVDEEFVVYREFDLRPSNQHILVRVIASFRLVKMCLCHVSLVSRCGP
jgi:hypothetical protein